MSKELNKALDLLREIRPSIPKDVLELWCKDRDAFLAQRSEFHQHLKECADEVATWPTYKQEALGPFLGHELGIEGETETANELNKAPVEQAGGDERDFQAKGAQEVPSPVSKEYDRHLIGLLRKGEALPGHQEEAADEIERLHDWNDHLNNTVLPNILNPNFLMLMKGGERLLDLCTKDGKFIGVSLNDMKDVFDWMVTHARIAPDQAALAQPSAALPPFAEKVLAKLRRFYDCASDFESGGVDIGRHWLDLLTQLGLLNRVQRSPAFWEISQQGEDLLEAPVAQAQHSVPEGWVQSLPLKDHQPCKPNEDRANGYTIPIYSRPVLVEEALRKLRAVLCDPIGNVVIDGSDGDREEVQRALGMLAAAPGKAQHSAPEVSGIGRDTGHPRAVVLYLRKEPTDDDLRAIHDALRSLAAAPGKEVPQAWLDVQAERRRQITAEGWTPEHDDLYCAAELPRAAAAYILNGANDEAPAIWPFSAKWWKPRDARANYVRAAALILAEIERLDRAAPGKEGV